MADGNDALPIIGQTILNAGLATAAPADEVYLPALPGTRLGDPSNLVQDLVAMGYNSCATWLQGIKTPVLMLNTRVYSSWFTLARMKLATYIGATNAVTGNDGIIASSLGNIRHKFANQAAREWSACKLGSMVLSGGAGGGAVNATLLFLLYGNEVAVVDQATVHAANSAYGRLAWMTQGVNFVDTLTKVDGFTITFNMNMEADLSLPMAGTADDYGNLLPNDYQNGLPILPQIDLIQRVSSGTVVEPPEDASAGGEISFEFNPPDGGTGLVLNVWNLKPDVTKDVQLPGVARVRRSYQAIMKDNDEPAFTWGAPA